MRLQETLPNLTDICKRVLTIVSRGNQTWCYFVALGVSFLTLQYMLETRFKDYCVTLLWDTRQQFIIKQKFVRVDLSAITLAKFAKAERLIICLCPNKAAK